MRFASMIALALLFSLPLRAQSWQSLGPSGGDVRALGHDPQNSSQLYLGTADGHVFGSPDAGEHWRLLGRVSTRLDEVLTAIVVDPRDSQTLYAAAWAQDPSAGGGVFRSRDGGRTWRDSGLTGQAVRALAQAPSAPDVLVAGTLDGVFLTRDAGVSWQRISPVSDPELRNIDSLAVDPSHPDVIYAGTFHLPWKTSDGGRTWIPIHAGMIDDSDVMSILLDRADPQRVYASACSGIYRSANGAGLWEKMQGIPYDARRTNVIAQDQSDPGVIFAGTTEGLWKSDNSGSTWRRMTPEGWVINAVELPASHSQRVVLGTEELGVLVSDDGGEHFRASNQGFNHRQVAAVAFDASRPGRILAVFAHAPEPIQASEDGGQTWASLGPGLEMQQLKKLFASPDGWWATLQNGGLMHYDAQRGAWARTGAFSGASGAEPQVHKIASANAGATGAVSQRRALPPAAPVVNDMAFAGGRWFAATEGGLFLSDDRGMHWQPLALGPLLNLPVSSVRVSGDGRMLWVVSLRGLVFSSDAGRTWTWHDLPLASGGALRLDLAPGPEGEALAAVAHTGLYISRDAAATWQAVAGGLPEVPVEDLVMVGPLFVASLQVGGLYLSQDAGQSWNRVPGTLAEGVFPVVAAQNGNILAASVSDGLYAIAWAPLSSATSSLPYP
jgi:photosystem II stability/assembly factor-like uncharacterized protein